MSGVADQHDSAGVPMTWLQPFDWPAMDLLVPVQTVQIFPDRSAEARETVAQAPQPALRRILHPWSSDITKTIGLPVTYWTEAKEAPVSQPKLQAG